MSTVDVTRDGPVWTVALNRPEKRNADETAAVAILIGSGGTSA